MQVLIGVIWIIFGLFILFVNFYIHENEYETKARSFFEFSLNVIGIGAILVGLIDYLKILS